MRNWVAATHDLTGGNSNPRENQFVIKKKKSRISGFKISYFRGDTIFSDYIT